MRIATYLTSLALGAALAGCIVQPAYQPTDTGTADSGQPPDQ